MARTFRRRRDGHLVVTLPVNEVNVLRVIARDIAAVVEAPPAGDISARLYPRAYLDPTEEAAELEFRALVHDDLVQSRLAALGAITDGLGAEPADDRDPDTDIEIVLTPEQEGHWLTALNDARLVIGTMIGVTEEDDGVYAPGDPRYEYGVLYAWLTALHYQLVELMLREVSNADTDDP